MPGHGPWPFDAPPGTAGEELSTGPGCGHQELPAPMAPGLSTSLPLSCSLWVTEGRCLGVRGWDSWPLPPCPCWDCSWAPATSPAQQGL